VSLWKRDSLYVSKLIQRDSGLTKYYKLRDPRISLLEATDRSYLFNLGNRERHSLSVLPMKTLLISLHLTQRPCKLRFWRKSNKMWTALLHHSKSLNSLWLSLTNFKRLLLIQTQALNASYPKSNIGFIKVTKLKQPHWYIQSSKVAEMRILKISCALVLPILVSSLWESVKMEHKTRFCR